MIPHVIDPSDDRSARSGYASLATYGRAHTIADIVARIEDHPLVVIDGEPGTGRTELRRSVAAALEAAGLRVAGADKVTEIRADDATVIVADIDEISTVELQHLARLNDAGLRCIYTRRPARPFMAAEDRARFRLVESAQIIRLLPLTQSECDALINEQLLSGAICAEPSSVERRWVWVTSGGFPRLAVALLRDADIAPVEEGSLARLSRGTLVAASDIVAGLSHPLRRLLIQLTPLVGVSFPRLRRSFDPVELEMLSETHAIESVGNALVIPSPVQAAVRLIADTEDLHDHARQVVTDICAAVMIGAECTEREVQVAAAIVATDSVLRDALPEATQIGVLVSDMWMARRRGDSAAAASVARRVMTAFPEHHQFVVRVIARNEADDLRRYLAWLDAPNLDIPPPGTCPWALCVALPLTSAGEGADAFLRAVEDYVPPADVVRLRALARAQQAAGMLESGDLDGALKLADDIAADAAVDIVAKLRAVVVQTSVHALRLDHDSLRAADLHFALLTRSIRQMTGLAADLAFRTAIDVDTMIALAFGAAGLHRAPEVIELLDELLTEALRNADPSTIAALVLERTIVAAQSNDRAEVAGLLRFLRRKRRTDLSESALRQMDGGQGNQVGVHADSRFNRFAVRATRAMTDGVRDGAEALRASMARVPGETLRLRAICDAFLAVVDGGSDAEMPDDDGIDPQSVPGAMLSVIGARSQRDATRLVEAATTLLHAGAAAFAETALDFAAELDDVPPSLSGRIRSLRRIVAAQLSATADASELLTSRERQVAVLAAQGLGNRDIARRLFLSVRTVESHLYRATRKLAVTRAGLDATRLIRGVDHPE